MLHHIVASVIKIFDFFVKICLVDIFQFKYFLLFCFCIFKVTYYGTGRIPTGHEVIRIPRRSDSDDVIVLMQYANMQVMSVTKYLRVFRFCCKYCTMDFAHHILVILLHNTIMLVADVKFENFTDCFQISAQS